MTKRPKLILYKDRSNEWRWRILAANGEELSKASEGYKRRKDCIAGAILTEKTLYRLFGLITLVQIGPSKWEVK